MCCVTIHGIQFDPKQLAEFCRRNGIARLSLFGSILRGDFAPGSDVDLLMEYQPDRIPSLLEMAQMELELTQIIGRKVDLRTPLELSRRFRQQVVNEAELLYAA